MNLITNKPKLDRFEGNLKAEVGNYSSRRLVGMLNIPSDTMNGSRTVMAASV